MMIGEIMLKNENTAEALFFVNALHYEGVSRKEKIATLIEELGIEPKSARYYVDRAAYNQKVA